MQQERRAYMGPSLRRLRRDRGITQAEMATALDVSPSYIALLERNHRPLSAEMLFRLAETYRIDMAALAAAAPDDAARLQAALDDRMFSDIDLRALEPTDLITNFPGIAEAFLRLHKAHAEQREILADQSAQGQSEGPDPVLEARRFLAAHRNSFPALDEAGERLAHAAAGHESLSAYMKFRHGFRVRKVAPFGMAGSTRRLDWHQKALLLSDELDNASQNFQLALQLAYLELRREVAEALQTGAFATENGRRLTHRAVSSYAAAAILMPYSAFASAVEQQRYDVEALARQFGVSFEQAAHRLTTLQRPGSKLVPFFFIRVDEAGNVSKRLDGAGFSFARQGGGCPLWNVHQAFRTPRQIITQWIELPNGERFFSIARTVTAGGGGFDKPRIDRAIALGCTAKDAGRLIYTQAAPAPEKPTPIGTSCRLCDRMDCNARSEPLMGRPILPDEIRRTTAPFGFSDT